MAMYRILNTQNKLPTSRPSQITYPITGETSTFNHDPPSLLCRSVKRDKEVMQITRERRTMRDFLLFRPDESGEMRSQWRIDVLPRSGVRMSEMTCHGARI